MQRPLATCTSAPHTRGQSRGHARIRDALGHATAPGTIERECEGADNDGPMGISDEERIAAAIVEAVLPERHLEQLDLGGRQLADYG